MRMKNFWMNRLLSLTLTLIFSMAFCGLSGTDPAHAESSAVKQRVSMHKGGMLKELALYLNLEPKALHDKLKKESLSEIAKQQGIDRKELKSKVMELLKERAASRPAPLGATMDFSAVADKLMDAKGGWHHAGKRHHGNLMNIEELAKLLKMTPDQLKQSLRSGKSLAKLAEENGVRVQSVIDLQVKAVTDRLDRRLAEGDLTKEQYEMRKAKVKDFVTDFVNGRNMKPKEDHYRHRSISQNPQDE